MAAVAFCYRHESCFKFIIFKKEETKDKMLLLMTLNYSKDDLAILDFKIRNRYEVGNHYAISVNGDSTFSILFDSNDDMVKFVKLLISPDEEYISSGTETCRVRNNKRDFDFGYGKTISCTVACNDQKIVDIFSKTHHKLYERVEKMLEV